MSVADELADEAELREEETLGSLSADVAIGAMLDDEDPLVGSCVDQRAFGNAEEIT
jgi:hypothetical protein